ncbi:MAG TPA: ATP-binding protein [Solirubrobacterales bacterium]|nr:ATP-binding protein [Solirubrobacterales bacterium]
MTSERPGLSITLPAKAENVAVVRHALAGLAERLGMEEAAIGDLKTVVTEACMNVVAHAYDGEPGPLCIEATTEEGGLTVSVRDFGAGIRPRPEDDRQSLRIGLTLIAALSHSFQISGGLGRGTEIRMHLLLGAGEASPPPAPEVPSQGPAEVTVDDAELVGPVLGRMIGALVARRQIPVERLDDAMLVTDAVAGGAPDAFTDGHFRFAVAERSDQIELRIGPLQPGAGERLRQGFTLPGVGGSLESLTDGIDVERGAGEEHLVVRFSTPSG